MNRSTMRTLARRRLNEVTPDLWSDSDINDLLNEGLHQVQKEVLKQDPLAFIYTSTFDAVKDQWQYDKPLGFWYEFELAEKNASAPTGYSPLDSQDFVTARDYNTATGRTYSHLGRFFAIFPPPTANVSAGYRLMWVPTLSMATDTDVPDLHYALHLAIPIWASLLGRGDTADPEDKDYKLLVSLLSDIPRYYRSGVGPGLKNESFSIDPHVLGKSGVR